MPLEEVDSSSEGDESDEEVNEEESQEAAFVVSHTHKPHPLSASCAPQNSTNAVLVELFTIGVGWAELY